MGAFDDLIPSGGGDGGGAFDDLIPKGEAPKKKRSMLDVISDAGITMLKGAAALPESIVGLADIPAGGRIGKALEEGAEVPGADGFRVRFDPKTAKDMLDEQLSDAQKAANREVQQADGFVDTIKAAVDNPSTIATTVGESLPSMLGGAGLARGALALAPKVGAVAAGAIGEGLVGAGSQASAIRNETEDGLLTGKQAAIAAATGIGTGVLGVAGGKLAQKMGVADIDTMLATSGGKLANLPAGFAKAVVGGGISEGAFEELPQSIQEQMLQNWALDKPLGEGVGNAAAMGLLAGAATGGAGSGFNALTAPREAAPQPGAPAPTVAPAPAATVPPMSPPAAPDARLAELELIAESRDLTPAEQAEATTLSQQLAQDDQDQPQPIEQAPTQPTAQGEAAAPAGGDGAPVVGAATAGATAAGVEATGLTPDTVATNAARKVLEEGGSEQDAMRAATDALISQMGRDPSISISTAAPAALAAAKADIEKGPILPPLQQGPDVNLQNRDRGRAASVVQMTDIARNPDYMRLGPSRTPDSGAPMVFANADDLSAIAPEAFGRDDVAVMSDGQRVPFRYAVVDATKVNPSNFADGRTNDAFSSDAPGIIKALNNGRTAGIRASHEMGTAAGYVQGMQGDEAMHGIPADVIARTPNPILVRVYPEGLNTAGMAAKSQGQGLGMSPAELARQDAPLLDSSVLGVYQPGDITAADNRDFVRAFVGKLQGAGQDVASMMTGDGQLSQDGRKRIQAALMQAAYGDSDLVEEMFDSTDTDIKAIGDVLKDLSGEWANMRDSAKVGAIDPAADLTENLLQVLGLIRKARRDRLALADLVNQPDLMTGETPADATVGMLRLFYDGEHFTRAVGKDRLAAGLRSYVRGAMATSPDAGLFGDAVNPTDILKTITTEGAPNAQTEPEQQQQQPAGGRAGGGGTDVRGAGNRQQQPAQGGDRPAEGGREGGAGPEAAQGGEAGQAGEDDAGDTASALTPFDQAGFPFTFQEHQAAIDMLPVGTYVRAASPKGSTIGVVEKVTPNTNYLTDPKPFQVVVRWMDAGVKRPGLRGAAYITEFFARDGKLLEQGNGDEQPEQWLTSADPFPDTSAVTSKPGAQKPVQAGMFDAELREAISEIDRRQRAIEKKRTERRRQREQEIIGDTSAWESSPFADRIRALYDSLRGKGEKAEGMLAAMAAGIRADTKSGRLTEQSMAFREEKARQVLAEIGDKPAVTWSDATLADLAEAEPVLNQLPEQISRAMLAQYNQQGPLLASQGFVTPIEVNGGAPAEAIAIARRMRDITTAGVLLAQQRVMQAKGAKAFKPARLASMEDFATQQLGMDTRQHPGVMDANAVATKSKEGARNAAVQKPGSTPVDGAEPSRDGQGVGGSNAGRRESAGTGGRAKGAAVNRESAGSGSDRASAQGRDQQADELAPPVLLTQPTRQDIEAQQDRAGRESDLNQQEQTRRESEVGDSTFMQGFDGDGRQDTTADLFGGAPEPEPAAVDPDAEAMAKAEADLRAALGDLGDILGKGTRLNITPEQEQKLLPVLTRVMDAAFRLGYLKFKDAAKHALDQIRAALGKDVANLITVDQLQGAYIAMAGRYKDQGAEPARAVVVVDDKADIERHTAVRATPKKETPNEPGTDGGVERNRRQPAPEPTVGNPVPAEAGGAAGGAGSAGGQAGRGGRGGQSDGARVSAGGTAAGGERGDLQLPAGNPAVDAANVATGDQFGERGGGIGFDGVSADPVPATQVDAAAEGGNAKLTKQQRQRAAESIPVKVGDIDNIRATLPYLLDQQQDDVLKAERQFAKADGYGMLFTNGTGTGKTYTGLGVVKRYERQGKKNILIVVPDNKIASDWIESGIPLGLKITGLKDTKDAGQGIVITTYANLGENDELARREWDLVLADEAHSLMQSADGAVTTYLQNVRALTYHPMGELQRYEMLNREDLAKVASIREQIEANTKIINNDDTMDVMVESLRKQNEKLDRQLQPILQRLNAARDQNIRKFQAAQGVGRTRLLALSATPFAYEFAIDWGNGYLFDYDEGQPKDGPSGTGGRPYNSGDNRERFFMLHFGYSMRYNKLNKPDPKKVDSGLLQRNFNTWLVKRGSVSGRTLDVPADYDRRFVLVESSIGRRIDEAIDWLWDKSMNAPTGDRGYSMLRDIIDQEFDHLSRRYLLEAIKAQQAIPIVKQHLAMGRKVVVFHDYKKGGGFNPFNVQPNAAPPQDSSLDSETIAQAENLRAAIAEFRREFKDLVEAPLDKMPSPIDVFSKEIPEVLLVNGDQKESDLLARYKKFQDDASGPQVMLVQSAKNKGWSGHDTTGKHQRVLINLGLPTAPTLIVQQEGRIYRTGQVSNAIFRYLNTGTSWEKLAFAQTIASRASASENLGMGELARGLRDSIIAAFEESDTFAPGHEGEGTGGKARDKASNEAISEYDRAKTLYWATQKKNSRTKAAEGEDYYPTPEPVGLKMVEFAGLNPGDDVLEPSGGHGAIARWIPKTMGRTVIEPSSELRARLAMAMDAENDRLIGGTFEDHNIVNKYDGIVMNPPFGVGGSKAIPHLEKAAGHLRNGGRIVAIIPTGPAADKRFDKWFYGEETRKAKPMGKTERAGEYFAGDIVELDSRPGRYRIEGRAQGSEGMLLFRRIDGNGGIPEGFRSHYISKMVEAGPRTEQFKPADGLHLVGEIKLPSSTFERAGTGVMTRLVIIEKQTDPKKAPTSSLKRDLTDAKDINALFDELEMMTAPGRQADPTARPEPAAPPAPAKTEKPVKTANPDAVGTVDGGDLPIVEHITQKGKTLKGIIRMDLTKEQAQAIDPYTFRKDGGFFIRDKYLKADGQGDSPVFSRGADGAPAMRRGDTFSPAARDQAVQVVENQLASAIRSMAKGPNVVVAFDMDDPRIPEDVRAEDRRQRAGGASGSPEGFYYRGTAYIIASQMKTPADTARVFAHEVLGHFGLRSLFGKELRPILQQIVMARPAQVAAKIKEYGLRGVSDLDKLTAAEEILAEMAQTEPGLGFVRRAVAAIRTWLRTNVPGFDALALSDDEIIRSYILPARDFVQRGKTASREGSVRGARAAAFQRGQVDEQTQTPEFKAWFGDWQALAAQTQLDAMEPIKVNVPAAWRDLSVGELRERVRESLDRMVRANVVIRHPELGDIRVGRTGERKTVSEGRDPAKLLIAADIESIIPSSINAGSEPVTGYPGVRGYSKLVARVDVGGAPMVAVFTLREQNDGQWYYNTVAVEDAQKQTPAEAGAATAGPVRGTSAKTERHPLLTAVGEFVRRPLVRVNPDSVSKVVDEQGRPLVVYHGTRHDFDAFDIDRGELGAHFGTKDQANQIVSYWAAKGIQGSRVMPAFLAIQNPLRLVDVGTFGQLAVVPQLQKLGILPAEVSASQYSGERGRDAVRRAIEKAGYDGVVYANTREGDRDSYIAFRPEQIKIATGNRGTFDADNPDIRFSRSTMGGGQPPAPKKPNAWQAAKAKAQQLTSPDNLDTLVYEYQDKLVDLKRMRSTINELGGTVNDLNDAYQGEELYHARVAKRTKDFLEEELRPLLNDMRRRGIEMADLEQYLHARHAPEANAVLAERNPNQATINAMQDQTDAQVRALELALQRAQSSGSATKSIQDALLQARAERARWSGAQAFKGTEEERLSLSGMTDAESKAIMSGMAPERLQAMEALAARVDAINARTVDQLQRYGLMDKETLDAWRSTYKFYVPLHRDEAHPDATSHPIGQGFSTKGDAAKRRTGSNEKVTNILGHIAMQREAALTRGEKNRVAKKLYLMAAQNPDASFWQVDKPATQKIVDRESGLVRTVPDPTFKNRPNVVMVRINGKDRAVVFNERNPNAVRLAQSIKNADVGDLDAFTSIMGKGTRWFAAVNTQYNPIFGIVNFTRDVQGAALQLSTTELRGQEAAVMRDVPKALAGIYREVRQRRKSGTRGTGAWAQLWEQMQDDGGTTGYRDLFIKPEERAQELLKEIKRLDRGQVAKAAESVVGWLSDYNETIENAVRLSVYKRALDSGISRERAASIAKNITVNFNRKGRTNAKLGAYYAFFNAAIQGTARLVETMRGPAGKKIALGGVMLGAANTLIGMAVMGGGGDDEEDNWEKIPDFVKERNIIVPLGREDYLTIPLPLGFNVLPNIGRKLVEMATHDDPTTSRMKHIGELGLLVLNAFNPLGGAENPVQMLAPTNFDPAIALLQNRDWTGRPIYRQDMSQLDPTPGFTRAKDSASTFSKLLTEGLNKVTGGTDYQPGLVSWTPDQVDYVIGQLTGGLGRELMKVEQTLTAPITGEELPAYKIPLAGRLYGNTRGPANNSEKFYENVRELNMIENEIKGRARAGMDVEAFTKGEPMADLVGVGNKAERELSELRKRRREIVRQGLPGYRDEAAEVNERIGQVMKNLNQQVKEAKRAAQ